MVRLVTDLIVHVMPGRIVLAHHPHRVRHQQDQANGNAQGNARPCAGCPHPWIEQYPDPHDRKPDHGAVFRQQAGGGGDARDRPLPPATLAHAEQQGPEQQGNRHELDRVLVRDHTVDAVVKDHRREDQRRKRACGAQDQERDTPDDPEHERHVDLAREVACPEIAPEDLGPEPDPPR